MNMTQILDQIEWIIGKKDIRFYKTLNCINQKEPPPFSKFFNLLQSAEMSNLQQIYFRSLKPEKSFQTL